MVWACGKNGLVPYGKKCVDGGSKWRAGTRELKLLYKIMNCARKNAFCHSGLQLSNYNTVNSFDLIVIKQSCLPNYRIHLLLFLHKSRNFIYLL